MELGPIKSQRSLSLYWKLQKTTNDICNLRYKAPKEIPVAFHNSSTCD